VEINVLVTPLDTYRRNTSSFNHPSESVSQIDYRRRTTFTVQTLRKVSVDHERLRNDEPSLPSQDIGKVSQKPSNSTFFLPCLRVVPKQGKSNVNLYCTYPNLVPGLDSSTSLSETFFMMCRTEYIRTISISLNRLFP
jgi:hypothetical protein